MQVSHASKYETVLDVARKCNAYHVSFQHHTFVSFDRSQDAEKFLKDIKNEGFLTLGEVNTQRPYTPFEVIICRW